ncbi:MAG: iron ABC transporter permease, partial [Acidobacteriota bacterium]
VVAGLFVGSLVLGDDPIPLERVLAALAGTGDAEDAKKIVLFRLPRTVLAALGGLALGIAGLLLQRVTRNALASPGVLGIVDGSAVGVLTFLLFFSNEHHELTVSAAWQPLAAILGALAFALTVGLLAFRDVSRPNRLILYGVAVAALADALAKMLILAGPIFRVPQALQWLAGSLHSASWSKAEMLIAVLAISAPALILLVRPLDQLRLDDASARATGLAVQRTRAAALILSVLWTAAAVSVVGGIGFVGLIAPHAARLVFGASARGQILGAALIGAALVLSADLLVQQAFDVLKRQIPAGAVTALIGAPYFLFLLFRHGRTRDAA